MRAAGFGLAVLSVINMLSYMDRYIVAGLAESLKHSELSLSDAQLGSLMSGLLLTYTLAAPVFGALGDRRSRPRLIAFAFACWSVSPSLSGFPGSFLSLLAARASSVLVHAPYATTPPTCGLTPSTSGHACVSDVARHAGWPAISTVGHPGPGPSGVP